PGLTRGGRRTHPRWAKRVPHPRSFSPIPGCSLGIGEGKGRRMGDPGCEQREVRRARYAVAAVFAVHGAVTGSFATRVPWIQDHAGVSAGQLGLALAFPALGAALMM